jgi:hypothetical protein
MPAFSDPPYPSDCPIRGLCATFDRYQAITLEAYAKNRRDGCQEALEGGQARAWWPCQSPSSSITLWGDIGDELP